MNNKDRDTYILRKIIKYCTEADATIRLFGDSVEKLRTDGIYRNATAMCVLQIGELVGHLSEEIVGRYSEMPWKQIRAMRNIAAHGYEEFDIDILWQTLKADLPALREYCEEIVAVESS
ncbi:MAG: DUF86 domain-containing protein [Oscillospiraceae bacterium]|nr:DUF86 domain-containing protein [Oscillospiraceae bacterium]